jgi:hypothetical protein
MSRRFADVRMITLACCAALGVSGCARKNVHAAIPVVAPPTPSLAETERPMNIAPDTDASPPVEATATPPPVVEPRQTTAIPLPAMRPMPAPRRPAEPPVTEASSEPPARPPAPQISPQLSPGDQASYERKTGEDASAAEKNLQSVQGKQLNAEQQDLVDKIRSFLTQSRDASKSSDWARAQNLAQKARLLSVELINSL